MRKLKLNPESLEVQTFEVPAEALQARGTVQAHQQSRPMAQCYSQYSCMFPCTHEPDWCV